MRVLAWCVLIVFAVVLVTMPVWLWAFTGDIDAFYAGGAILGVVLLSGLLGWASSEVLS